MATDKAAKKAAEKTQPKASEQAPANKVTTSSLMYKHFTSPGTLITIFVGGGALMHNSDMSAASIALVCMIIGVAGAAWLTTKLENSEWRQELRRQVEEKERKELGITHEDKCRAAANMYMPFPATPIEPEKDAALARSKAAVKTAEDKKSD
eukprot:TRINITY_DN76245_c0_g1_i1.p2 TRINITY_DN76245_c0_g1~~TRINITY_DN76245_c0_g1_i1.p2  ORF type:complete len:152 (-),score=44.49 TRINITY_DN76245_c0_g1_i1:57-512(-)